MLFVWLEKMHSFEGSFDGPMCLGLLIEYSAMSDFTGWSQEAYMGLQAHTVSYGFNSSTDGSRKTTLLAKSAEGMACRDLNREILLSMALQFRSLTPSAPYMHLRAAK
jgi:hypothetical protein